MMSPVFMAVVLLILTSFLDMDSGRVVTVASEEADQEVQTTSGTFSPPVSEDSGYSCFPGHPCWRHVHKYGSKISHRDNPYTAAANPQKTFSAGGDAVPQQTDDARKHEDKDIPQKKDQSKIEGPGKQPTRDDSETASLRGSTESSLNTPHTNSTSEQDQYST